MTLPTFARLSSERQAYELGREHVRNGRIADPRNVRQVQQSAQAVKLNDWAKPLTAYADCLVAYVLGVTDAYQERSPA